MQSFGPRHLLTQPLTRFFRCSTRIGRAAALARRAISWISTLCILSCASPGKTADAEADHAARMIAELSASEPGRAALALQELKRGGACTVGAIMEALGDETPLGNFGGQRADSPANSALSTEPVQVDTVLMYVVDSILLGKPYPYLVCVLFSEPPSQPESTRVAADLYRGWYFSAADRSLNSLRSGPHPLAETNVSWCVPRRDWSDR